MNDTKKCSRCQELKQKNDFYFKNKKLNKLQNICKTCQNTYHKKYYDQNKDAYISNSKKRNIRYRSNNKTFIDEFKNNKSCLFCQEKTPVCLDFHHIKNKRLNVSRMKNYAYSIKTIKKEIDKCIIICSNCHRKLHAGIITYDPSLF